MRSYASDNFFRASASTSTSRSAMPFPTTAQGRLLGGRTPTTTATTTITTTITIGANRAISGDTFREFGRENSYHRVGRGSVRRLTADLDIPFTQSPLPARDAAVRRVRRQLAGMAAGFAILNKSSLLLHQPSKATAEQRAYERASHASSTGNSRRSTTCHNRRSSWA